MDWNQIFAAAINSVLVLMAVQALKTFVVPFLGEKAPWVIPLIAMGIGPLMVWCMDMLGTMLGYPIDLSPIIGVFLGGTAVALHQVGKQVKKAA